MALSLSGAMLMATAGAAAPALAGTTPPSSLNIGIVFFAYHPNDATVAPGATITVKNFDWKLIHEPHSLTAFNGAFDTGVMATGPKSITAPEAPGDYRYYCTVHGPSMFGVIRVVDD